jgi:hypothetical protein
MPFRIETYMDPSNDQETINEILEWFDGLNTGTTLTGSPGDDVFMLTGPDKETVIKAMEALDLDIDGAEDEMEEFDDDFIPDDRKDTGVLTDVPNDVDPNDEPGKVGFGEPGFEGSDDPDYDLDEKGKFVPKKVAVVDTTTPISENEEEAIYQAILAKTPEQRKALFARFDALKPAEQTGLMDADRQDKEDNVANIAQGGNALAKLIGSLKF